MNWEDVKAKRIGAISCDVHPAGMTKTEYVIARKIYLLQQVYDRIEDVRWWIYVMEESCRAHGGLTSEYSRGITKRERAQIKRRLTLRINELKKKLPQVRPWLREALVVKDVHHPKYEEDWMRES